jgi:uncharacterized membrane protein YgaE (UPF0421/DUF939 family)
VPASRLTPSPGTGGLYLRATVATVLAFVLAAPLPGTSPPVLAALTALLVVQVTVEATARSGLQRVASVTVGVLLAEALSLLVGLTWWSLALVVLGSLLVAQALRLGSNLVEVPISAMLVLSLHGQSAAAALRVDETLVGALVGMATGVLLLPPVQVVPAVRALREVVDQVGELLLLMGFGLAAAHDDQQPREWLVTARRLSVPLDAAAALVDQAEESARWNPRARGAGPVLDELRASGSTVENAVLTVRGICRQLVDRPPGPDGGGLEPAAREALSDLLLELAETASAFGTLLEGLGQPPLPGDDLVGSIEEHLEARRRVGAAHARLTDALLLAPRLRPELWQADGSLLGLLARLSADLDAPGLPQPLLALR